MHRQWNRTSLASRSTHRDLRPRRPPCPTCRWRWRIGPLQQPSTRFTGPQHALKLAPTFDGKAHPNRDRLAGKPFKISGLFESPIHPRRRHLETRKIDPFHFQNPHQLSTGSLAVLDGRTQGLIRPINKNAQETPGDELEVDEFIAQARERLFNDLL